MKRCSKTSHRLLASLLLAMAPPSFPASGADKPADATPRPVSEVSVNEAWQRIIPEYTADNLPLGEIVKDLQNRFPELNFHLKVQRVPDTGERIDLGNIAVRISRLRNVTLAEFLKVLELSTEIPIQITGKPGDRLIVFDSGTVQQAKSNHIETRVFSLAKYLENRTPEEQAKALAVLENVIAEAGKMYAEASQSGGFNPRLNIHRGTKLLIVVGRPEELALVEHIVRELQSPEDSRRVAPAPDGQPRSPMPATPQRQ